jgi:hypothetical protein
MAGGKERLSQPLANQRPVARPKLNREGGLRITCVQKTGCGTTGGETLFPSRHELEANRLILQSTSIKITLIALAPRKECSVYSKNEAYRWTFTGPKNGD